MKRLQLNQKQIANRARLNPARFSQILNGKAAGIRRKTHESLCQALALDPDTGTPIS